MTRTTVMTMCSLLAGAACPVFPDIESDSGPSANSWPASSVTEHPPTGGASTGGAPTSDVTTDGETSAAGSSSGETPTTGAPPPTTGEPFPPSPDPVVSPVFEFLAMDLGDVDGDGRLDLVTAGTGAPPRVTFYPGAGDGSFAQAAGVDSELASFAGFVLADVTGDGHADVLAQGTGQPPRVGLYAGDGGGGFTAVATTELPAFVQMHAADVDGDGRADLLTGNGEGAPPRVQVWRGGPDGIAAAPLFTGEVFTYTALRGVDLDGDGHPDLATAGTGAPPRLNVYAGDGLGGFSDAAEVHELYNFSIFDGGDVDGDGRGDVVTDVPGNMWRFAVYRSTPGEWPEPALLEGFNFVAFELGDVDGDGRADIVARPTGAPPRVEVYLAGP